MSISSGIKFTDKAHGFIANTIFTRNFNSFRTNTTPDDLVHYYLTPNMVDWKIVTAGPNRIYRKSLRVAHDNMEPCIAVFPAIYPCDTHNCESIVLFSCADDIDIYIGHHKNLYDEFYRAISFIGGYVEPGNNYPVKATLEFVGFKIINPRFGISISWKLDGWYILRTQAYERTVKIKLWEYGTVEPEPWDYETTYTDPQLVIGDPGLVLGIAETGGGSVDFAYYSIGYGIGNLPALPLATLLDQWPHDFLEVPNSDIGEICGVVIEDINEVSGVG